jgi:hypothetical protein
MKKTYWKPAIREIQILVQHPLLTTSLTETSSNLSGTDNLDINETPQSGWGR